MHRRITIPVHRAFAFACALAACALALAAFALALAAFALALAACSKQTGEAPTVTYNCSANAREIEALRKDIPAFRDSAGIDIALNPFSGEEKLYAMIAADQAPDIFYTNNVVRDRLAAEGRLLDLRTIANGDPFMERLRADVFSHGTSIDGGWYGIGNWLFTAGVYYNRALFDQEGIAYPDSAWTWDDMERIARRLSKDANKDGVPEQYGVYIGSHFIEAFELMNGAPIPRDALFASIPEQSRAVYRKYLGLMERNAMPDIRRVQAMGMQSQQMLESGKVAMLVEAVPNAGLIESLTIPWGVAPLPRFPGVPPLYFRSGSGGLSVSARAKNPKAAWTALKWIISGASYYQPNPVLRDADFIGGWEARYHRLKGSGFADVWRLSEQHGGGDPRYFVRYSSFAMNAIMEQLQPKLDRLWARRMTVDELVASLPEINSRVRAEIERTLKGGTLSPAFRSALEKALRETAAVPK